MFQKARLIHVVRKYLYNRLFSDWDFTEGLKRLPLLLLPLFLCLLLLTQYSPLWAMASSTVLLHSFRSQGPVWQFLIPSIFQSFSTSSSYLFHGLPLFFPLLPHSGSNYLFSESFVISPFNTILIKVILKILQYLPLTVYPASPYFFILQLSYSSKGP